MDPEGVAARPCGVAPSRPVRIDDRAARGAGRANPAVRRRRWLTGSDRAGGTRGRGGRGAHRLSAGPARACGAGGPARAAATAWGGDRRAAIERAFAATGSKHAAQAFAVTAGLFDRLRRELDRHVQGSVRGHAGARRAVGRRARSADGLSGRTPLRPARGDGRASRPLIRGVGRQRRQPPPAGLPTLDRWRRRRDVTRPSVRPPDDPAKRAAVAALARGCREGERALAMSGQCDAAAKIGPTVVERAKGARLIDRWKPRLSTRSAGWAETCTDSARAIPQLEDAAYAAIASRPRRGSRSKRWAYLNLLYLDRSHDLPHGEALDAGKRRRSSSARPATRSWKPGCRTRKAILLVAEGDSERALAEQTPRRLAIQERLSGDSLDAGASLVNVAERLHELGRNNEAAPVIRARDSNVHQAVRRRERAASRLRLLDEAEILTELGRYQQARIDLERALAFLADAGRQHVVRRLRPPVPRAPRAGPRPGKRSGAARWSAALLVLALIRPTDAGGGAVRASPRPSGHRRAISTARRDAGEGKRARCPRRRTGQRPEKSRASTRGLVAHRI